MIQTLHKGFIVRNFLSRIVASAVLALWLASAMPAGANVMHLSETGTGQVLLFPYYTVRNDNVSLLSLVNTTVNAKAVRVNVREARGGFVVAQLNVYLSAKDVWTAAIVGDGDGAKMVTNDLTCTAPAFAPVAINPYAPPPTVPPVTSLPFSADAYRLDNAGVVARDRTREGYVEVIEMASIPNASRMGIAITHITGVPTCVRKDRSSATDGVDVTDIAYEPPVADLAVPTGGLMGSLSFVNVTKGMLASASPTVLDAFWLKGPDAPTPRVAPANSATIDLTSGRNTSVAFAATLGTTSATSSTQVGVIERYTARFASSIDAVSALLSANMIYSEYAYTGDRVIDTAIVATLPTKPHYIRGTSLGPFAAAWQPQSAKSCDAAYANSYTREIFSAAPPDDFSASPPIPGSGLCFVANPITPKVGNPRLISSPDTSYFGSPLTVGFAGSQNGGAAVPRPGNEGGWTEISTETNAATKLVPVEAAAYRRNAAGNLTWEPIKATLTGLPVIGFTLSQAAYQTGSPQQNYADGAPLRKKAVVNTTP